MIALRWLVVLLALLAGWAPAFAIGVVPSINQVTWTIPGVAGYDGSTSSVTGSTAGDALAQAIVRYKLYLAHHYAYDGGNYVSGTWVPCKSDASVTEVSRSVSPQNATYALVSASFTVYQSCNQQTFNGNFSGSATSTGDTVCPAGATMGQDGICKCAVGTRPGPNGSCVPYTCQKGGVVFPNSGGGPHPSLTDAMKTRLTCIGPGTDAYGCTLEYVPTAGKCADATHCWSSGTSQTNGDYCDGGNPPPTPPLPDVPVPPPPDVCGPGQCPGTVNGAQVCVACDTSEPPTTDKQCTGTDCTTTDKETHCDGTTCTTTTTTNTGTGPPVVNVHVEPQPGFCEQNPSFSACKSSSFGGGCGGFQCEGDAVQCAIAREQHQRNCQLFDQATPLSQQGEAGANGQAHPDGHPWNEATDADVAFSGHIDQSNPIGGSCPSDVSMTVSGNTLTVPLSKACDALQALGSIGVALSMLMAAFIAFKQ